MLIVDHMRAHTAKILMTLSKHNQPFFDPQESANVASYPHPQTSLEDSVINSLYIC